MYKNIGDILTKFEASICSYDGLIVHSQLHHYTASRYPTTQHGVTISYHNTTPRHNPENHDLNLPDIFKSCFFFC